jgi:hypothetical protein
MQFQITYVNPRKPKRIVTEEHFARSAAFYPVTQLAVGEHAPRRYETAGYRDIKRVA